MNAILSEAKLHLRDRRATLLRVLRHEDKSSAEIRFQASREPRDGSSVREPEPVLQRLLESHARELKEIDAALKRLEEGSYGQCEQCGGAIGYQRLRAIPEGRCCIACTGP